MVCTSLATIAIPKGCQLDTGTYCPFDMRV
jgi:hypothetical protein